MAKLRNVKVRRGERYVRPAIKELIEAERAANEEAIHMMDDLSHRIRNGSLGDQEITEMVKNCRIQYCKAVDARAQTLQAAGPVVLKRFLEGGMKKQEFNRVKNVFYKEKERDPEKYIGRNGKLMLLSDDEEDEEPPAESPLPSQQPVEESELNEERSVEETTETHRKVRFNLADNTYYVEEARQSGAEEENNDTAPAPANGAESHHDGEGLASESAETASVEGDKLETGQARQSKKRKWRRRANRNDSSKTSGRKRPSTDYSSSDSDEEKQAEADSDVRPPPRKRRRRKLAVQGPQFPSDADIDSDIDAIIELDSERVYCYCRQQSDGAMVGCDAEGCANEWFHLRCARLKAVPTGSWFCRDCKKKYGEAIPLRQPEQLRVIKVEVVDGEEQMSFPGYQNAGYNSAMENNALNAKETGREVAVQRKLRTYGSDSDPDVIVLDDERVYCICDRVSYDHMTRCHARGCKIEWYHIRCMGLKEIPEAPWFCPSCQEKFAGREIPVLKRGPDPELRLIKEEVVSDEEVHQNEPGNGADAAWDKNIEHLDRNLQLTMNVENAGEPATNEFLRPWLIRGTVGMQRPLDSVVQLEEGRLYCICGRLSHELMVPCHGEDCSLVWFHLSCVGLKAVPEEEWFCPRCRAERDAGEEQGRGPVRGVDAATNRSGTAAPVAYDPNKIIKQEVLSDDGF